MHTYIKHREPFHKHGALYTVGYYTPAGLDCKWHPLADVRREEEAQALVNYLNGGSGNELPKAR